MEDVNDSFMAMQNIDIDDLTQNLQVLVENNNLKRLDLSIDPNGDRSKNLITLPKDLSLLVSLEELNLNGNKFQDIYQVINCLTTLPNLV